MSDEPNMATQTFGGTAPGSGMVQPESTAQAAETLRGTTGSVLFRGAGTKLDWAGRVAAPELVIDTSELTGLITHNAADMTASVLAGTPLTDLQALLAPDGQWLALDPPTAPAGATLGGLLAAGESGPSRLRYGNLRDLVIGVTLVLGDGTIARSGSHVIKNVAGYDLAKLVHGSLGSLAMIAEVILRLHPLPVTSCTLAGEADADQATAAALALSASPLEPSAVEWIQRGDGGTLVVRCDGTQRAVEISSAQVRALLAGVGITATITEPGEAERIWREQAELVNGSDGDTVLRVGTLPGELGDVVGQVRSIVAEAGMQSQVLSSAALGVHTIRLYEGSPSAVAGAVDRIRALVRQRAGTTLVRRRPADVEALLDVLGEPGSTAPLLRRIKAQFDPTDRCAPGRFAPWF